jgi:hypothetical protein
VVSRVASTFASGTIAASALRVWSRAKSSVRRLNSGEAWATTRQLRP